MELEIDRKLLEKFEEGLDPRRPEASAIPAAVLGYGEISTVFEIGEETGRGLAYKRMPIFTDSAEMDAYAGLYKEYNRLLSDEVGLELPPYGYTSVRGKSGIPVFYIVQEKLEPRSIGNSLIHLLEREEVPRLVRHVLRELQKVWEYNWRGGIQIGIDGQISNWSVRGFDPSSPGLGSEIDLLYLDTSTPLHRVDGVEQLDPELFLRSAPSFLVWLLRWLFLEDVMTRYYDFRLVTIDLIANFHKEQLPDLIPALIDEANDFFSREASGLGIEPVTARDVRSYYREDAIIWSLYLAMRKVDRFLRTRIARRDYPYILPGKIKRH